MSFGGNDNPFGGIDLVPQGAGELEQSELPLAEVVAAGDAAQAARLQDAAAHAVAEEPEKTRAEIRLAVETEWDYCGLEPCEENAELASELLVDYQADEQTIDPTYILGEAESPAEITAIVARCLQRREQREDRQEDRTVEEAARTVETEETEEEAEDREATAESYQNAVNELAGRPNTEKIQALLNDDRVPEAYKEQLRAFVQIITIADRVPADAPIIRQRINQLDFSQGVPSPVQFIQTAIFSSPDHDSGVSEATQEAMAEAFGLTPHRVVTGSDYEDAMNAVVVDEDGNELPAYPEDEPLSFGVGLDGFTSDDGETQYMRATPEHGHGVTIDVTSLSPESKALLASYLDTWRMTEDAGESEWLLSLTQYDIRGQSVVDPIKLIEAQQVVNAVYGGFAGYNGEVLRGEQHIGMIQWQAQLRTPKGDAARSDRNPDMTATAMQGLGIQDESGRIDLDMLRAFGAYSRDNWFGAPDYNAVQAHLAELFPQKFDNLAAVSSL